MRQAICVLPKFPWRERRQLSAWAYDLVLHSVGLECSIAGFLQWVLENRGLQYTRAGNILDLLRTHRNPSLSNASPDCRDPPSRRALASTNTAETAPTPRPHNRQERDEEPLKVGFSNILKSISGTRTRKLASIRILRTANNIIVWGWHSITPRICNDACARG